ncbi:MAG: flagellar protein FlbD [Calditrichaeota bacterium]|nr:flagellar protein FlbD [Calditrichota bacterium]
MIEVTRLDGRQMVINGDQVERIEALPDTIISLTSGRKVIVRESVGELVQRLLRFRSQRFDAGALPLTLDLMHAM